MQGNNLFSKNEEDMASYLKKRNLDNTNQKSKKVVPKINFYSKYGKRILDLVIIIPVIIILSPVYLILCVANLIALGKPIFYKQTRYGYNGKNYSMYKFRSMKNITDSSGRQLPSSQRLTTYGRFIRKLSLDELPNLFNILKGDMSIIGPRAVPIFFMERMSDRHKQLSLVRPGLECPKMIDMELTDGMSNYQITFENNIWYVENISFLTDLRMIFRLVKVVFSFKERTMHANSASFFVGYDDDGRATSMALAQKQYNNILLQEKDS